MSVRIKGHILEDKRKYIRTHNGEVWVSPLLFIPFVGGLVPVFAQLIALIKHFPHENQQKSKKEPTSNIKATVFSSIVCKKRKRKRKKNEPTSRVRIKGSEAFCCGRPPGGAKEGVGFSVR